MFAKYTRQLSPTPGSLDFSDGRVCMQGSNLQRQQREDTCKIICCVKKTRSGLIYMSFQCLYCRLIKPGLTGTALQVFGLWRDRWVTEETKNLQDLECMFGTVPAARRTSKWRLQGDRPLHLLITPTWAVEGSRRAWMKQREKPSSHFFMPQCKVLLTATPRWSFIYFLFHLKKKSGTKLHMHSAKKQYSKSTPNWVFPPFHKPCSGTLIKEKKKHRQHTLQWKKSCLKAAERCIV